MIRISWSTSDDFARLILSNSYYSLLSANLVIQQGAILLKALGGGIRVV